MMDYLVREATGADTELIARVHVASWQETYRGLIDDAIIDARTVERRTAQWSEALRAEKRITLVACVQKGICGFVSAVVEHPSQTVASGYLQTLYVLRAAQGFGIGRALLRAAAQELCERGCTALTMHVLPNNLAARGFYERLGARYVGDRVQADDDDDWFDAVYEWSNLASLAAPENESAAPFV